MHHVTEALAAQRVSIEEFHTSIREAPMAGGTLFVGEAVLRAPLNVAADDVRPGLEKIAHELMVDIELSGE